MAGNFRGVLIFVIFVIDFAVSALLAACTCYDSDSNNCSQYSTSDVKFPKRYSGFTIIVQHSYPLSTPALVYTIICRH
jgi:hypothetical protein